MPTTVKKKLHDQVMDMIDALTTKAITAEELKTCLDLLEEVYDVQGTLIYLRDQNTKALEKSIGRAESLDDKLKLLHEAF